MASSAKARKRKPAPQRSKLPRYVVKLHDDDFFDEEDAEALRFDNFDDAVECCADLNIPFFVDAGNKKLVFWFVRVDDEGSLSRHTLSTGPATSCVNRAFLSPAVVSVLSGYAITLRISKNV